MSVKGWDISLEVATTCLRQSHTQLCNDCCQRLYWSRPFSALMVMMVMMVLSVLIVLIYHILMYSSSLGLCGCWWWCCNITNTRWVVEISSESCYIVVSFLYKTNLLMFVFVKLCVLWFSGVILIVHSVCICKDYALAKCGVAFKHVIYLSNQLYMEKWLITRPRYMHPMLSTRIV